MRFKENQVKIRLIMSNSKIFKIKESQFQNMLETVESLLYCIWWPSQPDYVKIGYGNIHRPSSSSYTTPFGSNVVLKVWLPSVPFSKTKMFSIEQDLHKKLRNNIDSPQEGGTEVYNISFKRAYFNINQYITTEVQCDFKTFITTISEYKTMIKPYLSRDYIIISIEDLLEIETKCDHCHKPIKKAHKCLASMKAWQERNQEYLKEYRSREEIKAKRKEYIKANREKINKQSKEWAKKNFEKNPEKIREARRNKKKEYKAKDPERYNALSAKWNKKCQKQMVIDLKDCYVRRLLCKHETVVNLSAKDIPQEMVEAKRLQIQIRRLVNEKCK